MQSERKKLGQVNSSASSAFKQGGAPAAFKSERKVAEPE